VPQVANDAVEDPRATGRPAQAVGVRNLACVRSSTGSRVTASCSFGNKHAAPFITEQERVRLRAFAHTPRLPWRTPAFLRETKSTKEYLENLIASSVDAIVTLDPLGRITS